jgi:hypothetical protein
MATRASEAGSRRPRRQRGTLSWWLVPGAGALWRYPVFLVVGALLAWYLFRALVHMAFLFVIHPFATFLLAFLLLPFAVLPAYAFLFYLQRVPRVWQAGPTQGRRLLWTAGGIPAAFVTAVMLDLIHIDLLRLLSIRLPRLPLDPF